MADTSRENLLDFLEKNPEIRTYLCNLSNTSSISEALEDPPDKHEGCSKTPENYSKTPENYSKTSENCSKTPENYSKTPENCSKTPENCSKTPENYSKPPEGPPQLITHGRGRPNHQQSKYPSNHPPGTQTQPGYNIRPNLTSNMKSRLFTPKQSILANQHGEIPHPTSNPPLFPSQQNFIRTKSTSPNQCPNYKQPQQLPAPLPNYQQPQHLPAPLPNYQQPSHPPPLRHLLHLKPRPRHSIHSPLSLPPTENSVREISVMVTFVHDHNATMFWAQIISPETISQTAELEHLLQLHCPCLLPVRKAQRHLVFATLWDGSWFRCVTITAPDKSNIIEVFFVDYGNRCKRRVAELVQLPYLFASIPFLAYPFRMEGLIQDQAKEIEAIGSICVSEPLTGAISTALKNDQICSIILMRPPHTVEQDMPECRSYNAFLKAKGYVVTQSFPDHTSPLLLPTSFYIKSLSERLVKAERKLAKLKVQRPNHRPVSISPDTRQPIEPLIRTPTKNASHDKENVVPNAGNPGPENPKIETPREEEKAPQLTSAEITTNLFMNMFEEVKKFVLSCKSSTSELMEVKVAFEQLQNATLPVELIGKKDLVDDDESLLSVLQEKIRGCVDKKELDGIVGERDRQVVVVRESIQDYLKTLESCNAEALLFTVKTIRTEFGGKEGGNLAKYSSPEEAFQVLSKLETNYKKEKMLAHTNCNSSLNQTMSYLTGLAAFIKSTTDNNPDTNNETLPQLSFDKLFNDLKHHHDVVTAENKAISPVLGSLNTLILTQANNQYSKMNSFVNVKDEYLKRSEQLSTFSQDKPDVSKLTELKTKVKKAKRNLKLALLDINSDSENESDTETEESLTKAMFDLHLLYKEENTYLSDLVNLAQTQYPELMISYPQLSNLISGNGIIKRGWELNEFVPPNCKTYLNSEKQLVLQGIYCGDVCFIVDYSLRSGGESLESEAVEMIRLEECFAIFIDSKRLQAYGCSLRKPQ